ncbi:hypothetical protein PR048_030693 [Dryococelus australis]|uniref:Uncharacterized protein n=1 Tax=Dryococelus australis TaxID=614101 RepID=A0ABQ9G9M5_9NEOP|nr:hypothetical protein PR048_030693 [Dryococelus australis]
MPDRTFQTRPIKTQVRICIQYSFFSTQRKICAHYALHTKTVHKKRKYNCIRIKENDIAASMEQPLNNIVYCFDMQAVIPLPCGNVSIFYYNRKLNALNFTIYDLTKRANEIASFLYDFLKSVGAKSTSYVTLIIARDDATHSLIERKKKQALKSGPLFVPSQIGTIAQVAKTTGKPYKVQKVDTTAILGWKSFYQLQEN